MKITKLDFKFDYVIKSLIKIYIKYCQKLDFEAFPNIPMKTLILKIKNSNSNLIKSLIEIYIKYCHRLDFEAFP